MIQRLHAQPTPPGDELPAWFESEESDLVKQTIKDRLAGPLANDPRFQDLAEFRKSFPKGKAPRLDDYGLYAFRGQDLAEYCAEATDDQVNEYLQDCDPSVQEISLARAYYRAFGTLAVDHLADFLGKHPDVVAYLNFMTPAQLTEFALGAFIETAIDLLGGSHVRPSTADTGQIMQLAP